MSNDLLRVGWQGYACFQVYGAALSWRRSLVSNRTSTYYLNKHSTNTQSSICDTIVVSCHCEFQCDSITNAMPKRKKSYLDWEQHKAEINDHYLVQDRSLKALMKYIEETHVFRATFVFLPIFYLVLFSSPFFFQFSSDSWQFNSKAQYETQLKKWDMRKIWPKKSGTTLCIVCENGNSMENKVTSISMVAKYLSRRSRSWCHDIKVSFRSNCLTQLLFPVHRRQLPLQRPKLLLIVMLVRPIHHNRGCQRP